MVVVDSTGRFAERVALYADRYRGGPRLHENGQTREREDEKASERMAVAANMKCVCMSVSKFRDYSAAVVAGAGPLYYCCGGEPLGTD